MFFFNVLEFLLYKKTFNSPLRPFGFTISAIAIRSLGIISENNDKNNRGMPAQHCFGLNEKSANYIAKRFNKKLDSSFKDIQISQYKFFLFY